MVGEEQMNLVAVLILLFTEPRVAYNDGDMTVSDEIACC